MSVYAVNGSTTLPTTVTAGDNVTYRLQYHPTTDNANSVSLTDYLPRVFDAGSVTTLDCSSASSSIPAAGTVSAGPADTFSALYPGVVPTLSDNTANGEDSFTVSFGNLDDALNQQSVIDLLVTVTARQHSRATTAGRLTTGSTRPKPTPRALPPRVTRSPPLPWPSR